MDTVRYQRFCFTCNNFLVNRYDIEQHKKKYGDSHNVVKTNVKNPNCKIGSLNYYFKKNYYWRK